MNYVNRINELSKLCFKKKDAKRIEIWLSNRNLLAVKEIISSEFYKFRSKNPEEKNLEYEEKYSNFTELVDVINEYLTLNNYQEDDIQEDYYD